jgi:hypothetical protein
MSFGAAKSLLDFPNWQFFSIALPYLHGGFTDEPLAVFEYELQASVKFCHHKFPRPIFRGMEAPNGDPAWNFVLWAVEADVWPRLENFLLSVVTTHTPTQAVYRIGAQNLLIADPLTPLAYMPSVPIVSFGVDSNRGMMAIDPASTEGAQLPLARLFKPRGQTRRFANLLLGHHDPVAANEILSPPRFPPVEPVVLRTTDLESQAPEKRAEYMQLIQRYRQELGRS